MQILLVIGLLLLERLRFDLPVRRWWARVAPRPAFALAGAVPVPMALTGFDLRRLVPRVLTVLVALLMGRAFLADRPAHAYSGVNQTVGDYWAFIGLFVLILVATVGGRDRDQEVLAAVPAGGRSRIAGWALTLSLAALLAYGLAAVRLRSNAGGSYDALLPNAWELAQVPLLILGGGLLGLLVARLLPVWAAVPLVTVAAVMWTGAVGSQERWAVLAPMYEWVEYNERDSAAAALLPGSFAWHNAYLAGLCGLGLVAALLREPGRRLALVIAGVALTGATVAAAVLALP